MSAHIVKLEDVPNDDRMQQINAARVFNSLKYVEHTLGAELASSYAIANLLGNLRYLESTVGDIQTLEVIARTTRDAAL